MAAWNVTKSNGMKRYRLVVDFIDDAEHTDAAQMATALAESACAAVNEADMTVLDFKVDRISILTCEGDRT